MAFKKGQGRIAGRQKGSKNKSTLIFENLLLENRAELLNQAIQMAKGGNERILLKLLDKIVPTLNSIDLANSDNKDKVFEIKLINTKDDRPATN